MATGRAAELLELARPTFEAYCERHGYAYVEGPGPAEGDPRPISWHKLPLMRELLEAHDHVLWVDADALWVDTRHDIREVREDGAFLLLTTRAAALASGSAIRDLRSRLQALPVVALAPPDDALLRAVLVKLFNDRQVSVDEKLIAYLAVRIERSFAAARAVVTRLDEAAMRLKRPLTRSLAAEILQPARA